MNLDELTRPLGFRNLDDAYAHYLRLLGDVPPQVAVRSPEELRDRIHESGFKYEELDTQFFDGLFEGDEPWGYGPYPREWMSEIVLRLARIEQLLIQIVDAQAA